MRAAPLALIAAALLTLAPTAAKAADPPESAVRLSYVVVGPGTKRCPSEQTLHDEVARRMGFDPFKLDAPDRIVATLKRSTRGLTATVERFDSKDVQQWQPKTWETWKCSDLVQAMGIYISFMLLPPVVPPEAATLTPLPSAAPPVPPKGKLSPLPMLVPPKVEPPSLRSEPRQPLSPPPLQRWAGRLAAGGGVSLGIAPADVAAVISLEGGVQWRLTPNWVLSGSLGALYSPRASKRMPVEMSGAEVEVGTMLITSVLMPCVHRHIFFGWVFGCAGFQLGGLREDGARIPQPASGYAWWAAVDPRLGMEVPLPHVPRLAARIFGDLPVTLLRPRALVGEGPSMSSGRSTPVWVTPPVAFAVSLGLVMWLGP
jgi:hypothetical protein